MTDSPDRQTDHDQAEPIPDAPGDQPDFTAEDLALIDELWAEAWAEGKPYPGAPAPPAPPA